MSGHQNQIGAGPSHFNLGNQNSMFRMANDPAQAQNGAANNPMNTAGPNGQNNGASMS